MRLRNFWVTTTMLFLILTIIPQVQAAPVAVIYEMEVSASPAVQGKGLPIDIICDVGFGGACCYTVYAHDVSAEILLPENITLVIGDRIQTITSPGQSSGRIAVDPGGRLTWFRQTWSVIADDYGDYNITVRVTGRNEGDEDLNESESVKISITYGASISRPVFPRDPVINEDIIIVAEVTSSESSVENVTLYYFGSQEYYNIISMENTGEDLWIGVIPAQNDETIIYYYMESLTEDGESFTTEIYSVQVKDAERIGTIKIISTYGTLAAFIVGSVLVLYVARKGRSSSIRKGMTILGASQTLSAMGNQDEIIEAQERLRKLRTWITVTLLIVMVVLLILSITTGQLQEVISHTTDPTGA